MKDALRLLRRTLSGRPGAIRTERKRAARVARIVWMRWQVGPWQWKCKHVRWFLECRTAQYSAWTRYRYWLTVERLLRVIGKADHWRPLLDGPWRSPNPSRTIRHERRNRHRATSKASN